MEWWVFPALVLCAVTFTAAAGVLVFLAVRGVWRLLTWDRGEHVARLGETRMGSSWVPWDTDPRFGSMQLDADQAYNLIADASRRLAEPWIPGSEWYPAPRDWREVAHEGDWRAQTAADLAPAVLDSGPGGPSLAPGPDQGELPGLHEWHDHAPLKWDDEGVAGCPSCEQHWECPPEPERTWAGRVVETSDEWLRRLVANAAPGWTYAAA